MRKRNPHLRINYEYMTLRTEKEGGCRLGHDQSEKCRKNCVPLPLEKHAFPMPQTPRTHTQRGGRRPLPTRFASWVVQFSTGWVRAFRTSPLLLMAALCTAGIVLATRDASLFGVCPAETDGVRPGAPDERCRRPTSYARAVVQWPNEKFCWSTSCPRVVAQIVGFPFKNFQN